MTSHPCTYLDNEDIRCVASPYPTTSLSEEGITTPVLSSEIKHVLLERLEKEIMSKLGSKSMCRSRGGSGMSLSGKKRRRRDDLQSEPSGKNSAASICLAESVVRSRFIVGVNQCTKILERAFTHKKDGNGRKNHQQLQGRPALILLARDVRPATILAHISLYARLLNIPTLVLPGKASVELGKAVGIRTVSVAMFLSSPAAGELVGKDGPDMEDREWKDTQNDVDSFVNYVISKITK